MRGLLAVLLLLAGILPAQAQIFGTPTGSGGGRGTGTVTSVGSGAGLTGGPITTSGTLSAATLTNAQTGTTYTVVTGDQTKWVNFSNSSAIAVTLPGASSAGFGVGWTAIMNAVSTGIVTITPATGTVCGAAALVIYPNESVAINDDGSAWQCSWVPGTAATANTGTSGATVPLNNGGFTQSGTANFTGTFQKSGNTMTFPGSAATLAALTVADQTVTGGANITSLSIGTVSSGTTTINCGARPTQYLTDGGAFTLAAPAADGSCIVNVTNNGSAGAITFSGFTVGSNTGDALDTTNGHIFSLSIWRVNGISGYRVAAAQ